MQGPSEAGGRRRLRRTRTSTVGLVSLTLIAGGLLVTLARVLPAGRDRVTREGLTPEHFPLIAIDSAEALVRAQVAQRVFPGAVLAAGIGPFTLVHSGVGRLEWSGSSAVTSPDSTIYDLASLTKAVATTSAVLLLWQDGRIRLDDPVQPWLPEFYGIWKERVTWRHLLTHTSGLPPAGRMSGSTPRERLASLLRTRLESPPGTLVQYSDVGYIALWTAAERVAREPLPVFLARRVWKPLGMTHTGYLPGMQCAECAPTLVLNNGRPFRGEPSDPTARALGGITGNAGLFSTAMDLARFASMIASNGSLGDVQIFRPDIVRQLFIQQPHAGRRTLGWDAFCPAEPPTESIPCRHPVAFGHYGWTGTSLWVDPVRRLWVVLLANRSYDTLHPKSMEAVREGVFATLAGERIAPPPAAPERPAMTAPTGHRVVVPRVARHGSKRPVTAARRSRGRRGPRGRHRARRAGH